MFGVLIRCTSIPGPHGCWAVFKDKDVAEKQAHFISSDIAEGKGFILEAYPSDGRRVVVGAEFVSRNTWEVKVLQVKD